MGQPPSSSSLTPDFSVIPEPLPNPKTLEPVTDSSVNSSNGTATSAPVTNTNTKKTTITYDDDEELEWMLVEEGDVNEKEFANSSDIKCRMGEPDADGFLHPKFDLHDWYLHVRATEAVQPPNSQSNLKCVEVPMGTVKVQSLEMEPTPR
jgi:hypothetical protein